MAAHDTRWPTWWMVTTTVRLVRDTFLTDLHSTQWVRVRQDVRVWRRRALGWLNARGCRASEPRQPLHQQAEPSTRKILPVNAGPAAVCTHRITMAAARASSPEVGSSIITT